MLELVRSKADGEIVHECGGWVPVDGASGLWAAASPTHRHQVAGVELAEALPVHLDLQLPTTPTDLTRTLQAIQSVTR